MKFSIGYGVTDNDFDNDTLLVGEDGPINQLDVRCPVLPEPFKTERVIHIVDQNIQCAVSLIEIESIEQLLDLSRKLGRDLVLERQPQDMFDSVGATLPEFCIVIADAQPE